VIVHHDNIIGHMGLNHQLFQALPKQAVAFVVHYDDRH